MAKRTRNESPERQALREMMAAYLKANPVHDGKEVNDVMREMMSVMLEGVLDGELEEELGYSKYDYKTRTPTMPEMDTAPKRYIQAMVTWI